MMQLPSPKIARPKMRFRLNWRKCVEGIDFIAKLKPGITQYYIGKIFYFADKEHFLDWGRPISGDRYIAMEHGPVPSNIYDLLKPDSGQPDEIADEIYRLVVINQDGNKRRVFSRMTNKDEGLSRSDKEYLSEFFKTYGSMSFSRLRHISHLEEAYRSAEDSVGLNNEMDLSAWANEICHSDDDKNRLIEELGLKADDYPEVAPLQDMVSGAA